MNQDYMSKLSPVEIQTGLQSLPDWKEESGAITRTFQFQDFPAALQFVNSVAALAEKAWHHPDIDIRWNKVTLTFTTHDEGGLTEKDFSLAKQCNALATTS